MYASDNRQRRRDGCSGGRRSSSGEGTAAAGTPRAGHGRPGRLMHRWACLCTVCWYEPAKGYGSITPDGRGGAEIFVHSSAIVGRGRVGDGQRVAFLVVYGREGTAGRPSRSPWEPRPPHRPWHPTGADAPCPGYDGDKGFGFITPDFGRPRTRSPTSVSWPDGPPTCREGDRVFGSTVVVSERGREAPRTCASRAALYTTGRTRDVDDPPVGPGALGGGRPDVPGARRRGRGRATTRPG